MKYIKMILTNRYDPDIRVHKEAQYLVSKGFDVEVLCWDRENEYIDKEIEIIDGVKVRRFFPFARYGTGFKQVSSFYTFITEIKQYLTNNQYDFLHCHDLDGIITGYFANKKKKKLIFDMHEMYELSGKNKFIIKNIVQFFQNKSGNIIYVNELQTSNMTEQNKRKLVHLPNYPETDNFLGANKVKSVKLRISYIGAVRQFDEIKNVMDACEGMKDIDIKVHGAGVAYKKLKEIEPKYINTTITGKYDYTVSVKLYNHTDVLYAMYTNQNLQYRQSYPVKLFEAIITKTPLIVNKDTVLADFVKKYDIGFVVDGNNVQDIRNLVIYLNENRSMLEEKGKNLEKIQYTFSWESVVVNLDAAYTDQ